MATDRTAEQSGDEIRLDSVTALTGYNLRRAQLAAFQLFERYFSEHDIRPVQFTLLLLLRDNPGVKHVQLARVLGLQRANMVALVNELESRSLLRREPYPADRRAHALFLSREGERLVRRLVATHDAYEDDISSGMGEREHAQLNELLRRLCQSLATGD